MVAAVVGQLIEPDQVRNYDEASTAHRDHAAVQLVRTWPQAESLVPAEHEALSGHEIQADRVALGCFGGQVLIVKILTVFDVSVVANVVE